MVSLEERRPCHGAFADPRRVCCCYFVSEASQLIQLEKVSFTYPMGQQALDSVDLQINSGDFLAVMGENGAGKTTLAKQLNGLLKPSMGKVTVDGDDTTKKSVAQLSRKVGIVFQNPDHLLFSETVRDEVGFALKN